MNDDVPRNHEELLLLAMVHLHEQTTGAPVDVERLLELLEPYKLAVIAGVVAAATGCEITAEGMRAVLERAWETARRAAATWLGTGTQWSANKRTFRFPGPPAISEWTLDPAGGALAVRRASRRLLLTPKLWSYDLADTLLIVEYTDQELKAKDGFWSRVYLHRVGEIPI